MCIFLCVLLVFFIMWGFLWGFVLVVFRVKKEGVFNKFDL